ncbi:MAG: prenyltransferase/squalene oxidase repeat-containing protein [Pirellulales bacterium]
MAHRQPDDPTANSSGSASADPSRLADVGASAARGGVSPSLSAEAGLWLNGDVLACACPDCAAPMTIRLWLMVADCWRCGASIELTEEQEAAARRLLERREEAAASKFAAAASAAAAAAKPTSSSPRRTRSESSPSATPRRDATKPSRPAATPSTKSAAAKADPRRFVAPQTSPTASSSPSATRGSAKLFVPAAPPVARAGRRRSLPDRLLRELPAWLVSLIVHLLALILLSLIGFPSDAGPPRRIVLTTTIGPEHREGGDPKITAKNPDPEFDLPFDAPRDGKPREVVLQAQQDAKTLQLDPAATKQLPQVDATKKLLNSTSPQQRTFAGRDPRLRAEVLKHEGGTLWTEAAVARGLHWLAQHQNDDGSWSLSGFHNHPNCRGRCGDRGSVRGDMAGTSLALLPFLGAGQTPNVPGVYRDNVARALRWLIDHQDPNTGDLRGDADAKAGMYVHGQATIVLCEAFSLTGNEALRQPCRKAVDFIARAQHPAGGWRYSPGEAGDTSVHGWQVMGLYSAKSATIAVPDHVLGLANQFLDTVASRQQRGVYGYRRGERETQAMTAEAMLCRFYLGAKIDDPGIRDGIDLLLDKYLPGESAADYYYWYYATQVMHHAGGEAWQRWNRALSDQLVVMQKTAGHEAGSWDPITKYDYSGGRIYTTALATCTLEVYYRHTPIFRKIRLD